MDPTRRFPDRSRVAFRQIELIVPVIGVGLQDAGISRQMRLGMLAPAVAGVVEHRRRRPGAAKRPSDGPVDADANGLFAPAVGEPPQETSDRLI